MSFPIYNLFSATYILRKVGAECDSSYEWLGDQSSVYNCAVACRAKSGCKFFIFGTESSYGNCYWEKTQTAECSWNYDSYNFYELAGSGNISYSPNIIF